MRDTLWIGKLLPTFNIIDDFNREAHNITISKALPVNGRKG